MKIICDSREQKNQHILKYFQKNNIEYKIKKVDEGDYKIEDQDNICIERKATLQEITSNIIQPRFKRELERSKAKGIHLIVLIENSSDINSIDEIPLKWKNQRLEFYKFQLKRQLGLFGEFNEWYLYREAKDKGLKVRRPPQSPTQLMKSLRTIENNKEEYDCHFEFCSKSETGRKILEILSQK